MRLDLRLARVEENLLHQLHGELVADLRDLDLTLRDLALEVLDQVVVGSLEAVDLGVLLRGRFGRPRGHLGRLLFRLREPVVEGGGLALQGPLPILQIGGLPLQGRDLGFALRDLLAQRRDVLPERSPFRRGLRLQIVIRALRDAAGEHAYRESQDEEMAPVHDGGLLSGRRFKATLSRSGFSQIVKDERGVCQVEFVSGSLARLSGIHRL